MPSSSPSAGFRSGLTASLPITLGYLPIAFSFGVAATRAGLGAAEAVFLSLVMYAGASQFLALALIGTGAPLAVSAVTLIAMNLRHVLYGPALLKQAGADARKKHAWAWAFGLTDEVFGTTLGVLARGQHRFSERFMFGIGLGAYASWVMGTALGAFAGGGALEDFPTLDAALGFMLPALFLALLLSVLRRAQLPLIAVAIGTTALVSWLVSPVAGIFSGMVAGAAIGMIRAPRATKGNTA